MGVRNTHLAHDLDVGLPGHGPFEGYQLVDGVRGPDDRRHVEVEGIVEELLRPAAVDDDACAVPQEDSKELGPGMMQVHEGEGWWLKGGG